MSSLTPPDPLAGLNAVNIRLAQALARGGRPKHAARLIAVTKTYGAELIRPLLAAGHREFGENRVQEALVKYPDLRREFPDLVLHLIGPLQSNKTREAIELFDVIQTLDRPKLAEALAAERARGAKLPRLLVQVNTGEEPQKAGLAPRDLEDFFTNVCKKLDLAVEGLMCIPPADEPPGPHFALLAKLAKTHGLPVLSMGMSGDFETAAALGATHVRVGSAIFGTRS
jgi:pyridoxal phosphate enzyme (YggS family)